MRKNNSSDAIAKRFGLEAIPENVLRLTQLAANRDASTAEIAKIICQDEEFTARVLQAANPRASNEGDYTITTVDAALVRSGIGAAMLLAMSDPLIRAIKKTFLTMLGVEVVCGGPKAIDPLVDEHLVAEVAFAGKAEGFVQVRMPLTTASHVAGEVLGLPAEEKLSESDVNDVVGELANIVAGNFKSNLCDAGLTCTLSPPRLKLTNDFKLCSLSGGLIERVAFYSPGIGCFVDLNIDPWS